MEADDPPFRYAIRPVGRRLFEIEYDGYMSEDGEHVRRTETAIRAASEPVGLYYDVSGFTGFHRDQVRMHGELFARLGSRVTGIAIVGARPVVRFGAISVALISKTKIKTFDRKTDALAWLESLAGRAGRQASGR